MKYDGIIVLVLFSVLFIGCTSGLPSEPNTPGTAGNYYRAIGSWATSPETFDILDVQQTPTDYIQAGVNFMPVVDGDEYVYNKFYVWSELNQHWNSYFFDGEVVPNSNWIRNPAYLQMNVDQSMLNTLVDNNSEVFFVAYSCSRATDGSWDCHNNKWQLQIVNVTSNASSCSDSDGGVNIFVKGTASIINLYGSGQNHLLEDECLTNDTLIEYSCGNVWGSLEWYNCSFGCSNGACINETLPSDPSVPGSINESQLALLPSPSIPPQENCVLENVDFTAEALFNSWGIDTYASRLATNDAELTIASVHLSTEELLDLKKNHGLGYILIPNITVAQTKVLSDAGILVFIAKYPGMTGPRNLPVPFSESAAYAWADALFTENPYLAGVVIDFETDDNGWGKNMFKGLHSAAQEHGKLLGIQPHFSALEINPYMSKQDYVANSDFLLVWYYGGNPYGDSVVAMYNSWKNSFASVDPNFPIFMEIATGEPNNGARPQTTATVNDAIVKLDGVTNSLTMYLGDLMLWHEKINDPTANFAGFENNINALGTRWGNYNVTNFSVTNCSPANSPTLSSDPDYYSNSSSLTTPASVVSPTSIMSQLVGYWNFDGNAFDSIGSINGTVVGAQVSSSGKFNGSYSFDGSGDWINLSKLPLSTLNAATINFWINSSSNAPMGFITNHRCNVDSNSFSVHYEDNKVKYIFWDSTNDPYGNNKIHVPYSIANKWTMVTISYMSGGQMVLYLDGVKVGSHAISSFNPSQFLPTTFGAREYGNSPDAFCTSLFGSTNGPVYSLSGKIDDVSIWSRVLSDCEVATLATGSCNVTINSTLSSSPNATQNTTINTVQPTNSTKIANFPGSLGDYILVPNSASLSDFSKGVTIDAWIKPTRFRTANREDPTAPITIISKGTIGNYWEYRFVVENTGKLGISIGSSGYAKTCSAVVSLNTWQHVAVVVDKSARTVKMYVNGVEKAVCSVTVDYSFTSKGNNIMIGRGLALSWSNANWYADQFSGNMDAVRVWKNPLTSVEIASMYRGNLSVSQTPSGSWYFENGATDTSGNGNNGQLKGSASTITGSVS